MATRVLIVDDHPLTRGALAALLGQNDFSVAGEAASGEEAIEVARELQPDLVLLDQAPRDRSGKRGLAFGGAAQELDDPLGRLRLQQVAGRAATDRGEQVLLRHRGGQHHDLTARCRVA